MERRDFLLSGAAAALSVNVGKEASAQCCSSSSGAACSGSQIGLILYTIRDYLKTPAAIAKALERVSKIGYRNVEIASCAAVSTKELAKMLKDNGLRAISAHGDFGAMLKDPQREIDKYAEIDCSHLVCSWMPNEYARTQEGFMKFARDCNRAGENLAQAGASYAYHNHSFEFHRYNGLSGQEILRRNTSPKKVLFEIDTYWIQHGGATPASWIRKVFGRCAMIHCKDFVMHKDEAMFAEVGEGNLDWPEIIKAARESGVRYFVVEQDRSLRDSMESIEISYKNLRAMGLS